MEDLEVKQKSITLREQPCCKTCWFYKLERLRFRHWMLDGWHLFFFLFTGEHQARSSCRGEEMLGWGTHFALHDKVAVWGFVCAL